MLRVFLNFNRFEKFSCSFSRTLKEDIKFYQPVVNQITFILYILSIILVVHSRNIWEIVFYCKVPELSSTSCWNSQIVVVVAGISIVFGQIRDGGRGHDDCSDRSTINK